MLAAGATHPFADWRAQEIYPDERYSASSKTCSMVARANLIFGLHVHVGIEDREAAIHIMNAMRYFLPHILALSTNSPFWLGMDTGLKSLPLQGVRQISRAPTFPTLSPAGPSSSNFVNLLDQDQLHRQRQEDLVGHPAASLLQHPRGPRLRHPDARWTRPSPSPR